MVWNPFKRKKSPARDDVRAANAVSGNAAPLAQDTRAAIEELSKVVRNNPEAVEIYLALGSLYRSQGEIERAIQIRNSLIVRPGLDDKFKARAWFELGRDYRRGGFLDRAEAAFAKASELGSDPHNIRLERARLHAERGDFAAAADMYDKLGLPLPQSHYLVRLARDRFDESDPAQAIKALKQACKVYPGAVEAWIERITHAYLNGSASRVASLLAEAIEKVDPDLRFMLYEGLLLSVHMVERSRNNTLTRSDYPDALLVNKVVDTVIGVLQSQEPDVLGYYYGGIFLQTDLRSDDARDWFEKALVLSPNFWLARLELFELSKDEQSMTPFFREQLEFFMARAHEVRRFYCGKCGLKRDTLFYACPRCHNWHSIRFRIEFSQ